MVMIRHIVMFNAKDPADKDRIFEGLKILEEIQGDFFIEVRANIKTDQIANDVDFVVYGEFPDEHTMAAYKADPIYEEAIRLVRPYRDMRVAADISSD